MRDLAINSINPLAVGSEGFWVFKKLQILYFSGLILFGLDLIIKCDYLGLAEKVTEKEQNDLPPNAVRVINKLSSS